MAPYETVLVPRNLFWGVASNRVRHVPRFSEARQRRDGVMNDFLSWCRHVLVPFLFHDLTSLHPPSFHGNDFYTCSTPPAAPRAHVFMIPSGSTLKFAIIKSVFDQ